MFLIQNLPFIKNEFWYRFWLSFCSKNCRKFKIWRVSSKSLYTRTILSELSGSHVESPALGSCDDLIQILRSDWREWGGVRPMRGQLCWLGNFARVSKIFIKKSVLKSFWKMQNYVRFSVILLVNFCFLGSFWKKIWKPWSCDAIGPNGFFARQIFVPFAPLALLYPLPPWLYSRVF